MLRTSLLGLVVLVTACSTNLSRRTVEGAGGGRADAGHLDAGETDDGHVVDGAGAGDEGARVDAEDARSPDAGGRGSDAGPVAPREPCEGITCGGHGTCSAIGGIAVCACEAGYLADGASCVPETSATVCGGVDCGGHGACFADAAGRASCRCDSGYYGADAVTCVPMGDGTRCDGVSCGAGSCVLRFTGFSVEAFCSCPPGYREYGLGCMRVARTHCTTFDGTLRERGELRCSAGDDAAEICRDDDGDGLVEWSFVTSCDGPCSATECARRAGECHDSSECPTGSICVTGDHGEAWPIGRCFGTCDCSNCGTCDISDFTSYGTRYCGAPLESTTPTMACRQPCPDAMGCIPFGSGSICWPVEGCYGAGDPS